MMQRGNVARGKCVTSESEGAAEGEGGKLPVSVFIIAKNEEARLPATLAALGWADQIVLVDSGSTDRTVELARAAGADVHSREWAGYGQQKAYAEGLCRHDWVLNVDADEVVSPALAAEIGAHFSNDAPPARAFRIRILNVYPGDSRPRPLAADYNVVRFYRRAAGSYRAHPLFDRVELAGGRAGQLRAPIHHFPLISWAHFVDKVNRYSTFTVEAAEPRSHLGLILRLWTEFPIAFLKFYILRRHLTGGWKGFAFSLVAAFGRALRVIKLIDRTEPRREK